MAKLFENSPSDIQKRGYAVLITNKYFRLLDLPKVAYPGLDFADPTRGGADVDDTNLQYVFDTQLNFQLLDNKTYKNVNKGPYETHENTFWVHDKPPADKAVCKCLSCRIQSTDHSKSDCFVLAISTHGVQVDREQEICFSDDLHCDRVTLSDIIDTLSDKNCPSLIGKPRLIILNLCRSDPDVPNDKQEEVWHDKGHIVTITEKGDTMGQQFQNLTLVEMGGSQIKESEKSCGLDDLPSKDEANEIGDTDTFSEDDERTNQDYFYGTEMALRDLPSNFLIVFPTVSGKKTFHNFRDGSWLIHELRNVVEDYDFNKKPCMNFLSVLTTTAGRVARNKESEKGYKTAVCLVHRLLRPLIFKDAKESLEEKPDVQDKPALFS